MKKKLLVLFLGNILRGDDGIGIELLKRISRRDIPEGIRLEEGSTGGMILLGVFDYYESVLVVDAVDTGDKSVDGVICSLDDLGDDSEEGISLHSIGIKDVLRFSKAMGESIPEVTIFGIQVCDIGEKIGLSSKIVSNLDKIESLLYDIIIGLNLGKSVYDLVGNFNMVRPKNGPSKQRIVPFCFL